MNPEGGNTGISVGTFITIATAICGALATAIGYIYRELGAVRTRNEEIQTAIVQEMKEDREKCEEGRERCNEQHLETRDQLVETREQLAELRGRVEERGNVRLLVRETIEAIQGKEEEGTTDGSTNFGDIGERGMA